MKHLAITGNMGSGKTTVCRIFEQLGIKVFYADQIAQIAYTLPHIQKKMTERFGEAIYTAGHLNKPFLANIIFSDKLQLDWVSHLIHPEVKKQYLQWKASQTWQPYTLYEAAILFETDSHKAFDKVIFVAAPEDLRIRRIMSRSGLTEKEIKARMQHQWPEENKIPHSDFVIYNNQQQLLIPQIIQIHHTLSQQIFH